MKSSLSLTIVRNSIRTPNLANLQNYPFLGNHQEVPVGLLPELWVDGTWNCAVPSEQLYKYVFHRDWEQRFMAALHPNSTIFHKKILSQDRNQAVSAAAVLLEQHRISPELPVEWLEEVTGVSASSFENALLRMLVSSMTRYYEPVRFYEIMTKFFPEFMNVRVTMTGDFYDMYRDKLIRKNHHDVYMY